MTQGVDATVLKAFANRPRDWQDIRGVIIRNGQLLEWPMIEHELQHLAELKEEPEIVSQFPSMRREIEKK